jgi:Prp8 binding protein
MASSSSSALVVARGAESDEIRVPVSVFLVPPAVLATRMTAQSSDAPKSRLASPVMELSGHGAVVLAVDFRAEGDMLLSAGKDRRIFLWRAQGECENVAAFSGHKGAVTDAKWSTDGSMVFSCSADKCLLAWDSYEGKVLRRMEGHKGIINALSPCRRGQTLVATASDDGTSQVWDPRRKRSVLTLHHPSAFPVTAVAFSEDSMGVLTGSIDGVVRHWDLRRGDVEIPPEVDLTLEGHSHIITALDLDEKGKYAASNSMDGTIRVWDVQAFGATEDRQYRLFSGAAHGREQSLIRCRWEESGERIAVGGVDRCVSVWDVVSGERVLQLPGHRGTVQAVAWSPTQPVLASGGNDGVVIIGEVPAAGEESGFGALDMFPPGSSSSSS